MQFPGFFYPIPQWGPGAEDEQWPGQVGGPWPCSGTWEPGTGLSPDPAAPSGPSSVSWDHFSRDNPPRGPVPETEHTLLQTSPSYREARCEMCPSGPWERVPLQHRVSPPGPAPLETSPGRGDPSRDELTSLLSAERRFWDACGRRPSPGTPRGAASLVVWSMERQECRAQARAGPQRWVQEGVWGVTEGCSPSPAGHEEHSALVVLAELLGQCFWQRSLITTRGVVGSGMQQGLVRV